MRIKEFISHEFHKFGPVILFNLLFDLFQSVTVAIPISRVMVATSEISKQITSFMFIVMCNIMKQYVKLNNTFVFVQWATIYQFTKQWESFLGTEFYPVWLGFSGVRGIRLFKFIFENCYTTCFILWNTMLCHLKDSLKSKFTRKWNMQWDCHRSFKVSFSSYRGRNVTY